MKAKETGPGLSDIKRILFLRIASIIVYNYSIIILNISSRSYCLLLCIDLYCTFSCKELHMYHRYVHQSPNTTSTVRMRMYSNGDIFYVMLDTKYLQDLASNELSNLMSM